MKPVAYAIFAENGNIRMWSETSEPVEALAEKEGLTVTPLYIRKTVWDEAIDAAHAQAVKYSERYGCGSKEWDIAYYIAQYINVLKLKR